MTNTQNDPEILVDDDLIEAIRNHQRADAALERALAQVKAYEKAAEDAQLQVDAIIEVEVDAFGRWRELLEEHEEGSVGVLFEGTVYPPRIDDGEPFEIRQLRSSGKPLDVVIEPLNTIADVIGVEVVSLVA